IYFADFSSGAQIHDVDPDFNNELLWDHYFRNERYRGLTNEARTLHKEDQEHQLQPWQFIMETPRVWQTSSSFLFLFHHYDRYFTAPVHKPLERRHTHVDASCRLHGIKTGLLLLVTLRRVPCA
ncbi:hypothetical protein M8C21_005330, partial [Ambrosia artemisiifolia]